MQMQFEDSAHSAAVLSQLRLQQQDSSDFCDVTLEVDDGKVIVAHRAVLAACSEYFRVLFSSGFQDSHLGRYRIPDSSLQAIEKVVHFMYSGRIEINTSNVEGILGCAPPQALHVEVVIWGNPLKTNSGNVSVFYGR